MKKLFAVLFCTFLMAGTAFADELSYEIDPVATAKAPWKVGERIVEKGKFNGQEYYREFLGVTQSGLALVQHFYLSGEKFSDPFLMTVTDTGNSMEDSFKNGNGMEGHFIQWYENGQKKSEGNFKNGMIDGLWTIWYENGQKKEVGHWKDSDLDGLLTRWYENGQKRQECNLKGMQPFGVCRVWGEQGNLIQEKDFGAPKD